MAKRINDENAELIGRPIIEEIIKAHSDTDYDKIIELIPSAKGKLLPENFNRGSARLKELGEVLSIEYLAHFSKIKEDLVMWRVKYEFAEDDIFWHLFLTANKEEIEVAGMAFDL